jgi:four helix bundle protein
MSEISLVNSQSPIQIKSYAFSKSIIRLYQKLKLRNEYVLATQILKSGTSIGANVEEAIGGQSNRDFHMKITIAYKEARETHYWLRLLRDCNYVDQQESLELIENVEELQRILFTIKKTLKNKMKKSN